MFRLGIVSDSHNSQFWLERYLKKCRAEEYDCVFHLGDLHSDARWLERRLEIPMICVAGNCDMFSDQAHEARATYDGHLILAVHGHHQDVKYGYDRLSYYAEERGADIALFGHTHRPWVGWVGRAMLINPGALMDGCYGELLIDGKRLVPKLYNFKDE